MDLGHLKVPLACSLPSRLSQISTSLLLMQWKTALSSLKYNWQTLLDIFLWHFLTPSACSCQPKALSRTELLTPQRPCLSDLVLSLAHRSPRSTHGMAASQTAGSSWTWRQSCPGTLCSLWRLSMSWKGRSEVVQSCVLVLPAKGVRHSWAWPFPHSVKWVTLDVVLDRAQGQWKAL